MTASSSARSSSELAKGHVDYAGAGILDITQVRFFTGQSAAQMHEQTGPCSVTRAASPSDATKLRRTRAFDHFALTVLG